jgi:transposase-like protein
LRWRITAPLDEGRWVKASRVDRRVPAGSFTGYRFPPEAILLAVRWYLRVPITFRHLHG